MRRKVFLLTCALYEKRNLIKTLPSYILPCVLLLFFLNNSFSVRAQPPAPGIGIDGRKVTPGELIQVCIGTTLHYDDSSVRASFIKWDFKNGAPSTYSNFGRVDVLYNTAGTDTTFQRVIRGSDTASMYILIKVNSQKPTASFTYLQSDQCGNVPISFNSSASVGSPLSYAWDFGDTTSVNTAANPVYSFLKAVGNGGTQNYTVKLVVKNNLNCYDSTSKTVTVKRIPDASLGNALTDVIFGPFNGQNTFRRCASLPFYNFQFTNKSKTNSFIVRDTIDWDDGSPDSVFSGWRQSGTIISHTFPFGKSNMKISSVGSNGCVGSINYIVFVGTTPAGSLGNIGENSVCAYNSLTFPLHDFGTNASGTTYTFSVNDVFSSTVYQHPPPDSITYVFNHGSCGNTSDAYENAYKASLFIENPCGSSTSPIVPLYVSDKPRANLDIYPAYNVCTNSTVTLSNASNFGGQITTTGGTGSTCDYTGKLVWQISPATGYTITAGDTGSIKGNRVNSTTWAGGSLLVDVVFNTPGIYAVKIFVGNDRCGIDSLVKTVCVRLPPTASFTLNKHRVCAPDSVSITNTSLAPSCAGDAYKWEVQYTDPQNCGGTGGYTYMNGTSASSKDPMLMFTQPGRYVLKLTVAALETSNTCSPAIHQDTIIVKAKPKATINPVNAVCIGNDISPTAVYTSCYSDSTVTYHWTFAGGNPSTSDQPIPGAIQYSAIGNYLVSLAAGNECGVTTDADSARITSTPAAVAGADRSACSGTPLPIGSPGVAGITYKWTPATGLTNANVADPILTLAYNGLNKDTTYTFVLLASAGANCSATDTVKVKIKKNPVVGVTPVNSSVCTGSGTLLVATGADAYAWLPAAGLNTDSGDSVIAAPANTSMYTVTGTSNGCAASATATVAVVPYVDVDAGVDTVVCNISSAIQLSGSPSGGSWSGSFVTTSGVFNATAATNGTYKLYYTAGTGVCTKIDSIAVKVIDPPVAKAGLDTLICQSSNALQLNGLPAGGRWSNSSSVTVSGSFSPATPGTYSLIYTIGGGTCIAIDTVVITVAAGIANNVISGDQSICTGTAPASITGQTATGGNGTATYRWQSSVDSVSWTNIAGATGTGYAPDTLTQTTWFRRVASTVLCRGPEASNSTPVKITVNPNATATFNPTTHKGCVPFMLTPAIINLAPSDSSVGEYRWYVNGNYIGSGTSFPGYTMSNSGDSSTVRLVAISAFGCVNDTAEHGFSTVEMPVPGFTQSDSVGCGPLTISFVNTTTNASRYQYYWDFGQGQTSQLQQPSSIVFPINPNFGDTVYTVTMKTITPCDTLVTTSTVKVRAHPKALYTPDKTEGCSPMTVIFTNTSRGSNAGYVWNFGDGSAPVSTISATISHTFRTGIRDTFFVKLEGANDCGSDSLVYAIVVNPNLIRIDFALNGNERFGCAPHTVHFINNSNGANSFTWNFGDGSVLNTFKNIDTVVHTYTIAGNFIVNLLAANGCSDTTDTEPVTVQLKPSVGFSALPLVSCITDTIRFTNTSDPNISYQWQFGDGTTSVIRDPAKAYATPGNYRVWLTGSRVFSQGLSCSDSAYADIIIQDTLQGDFSLSDSIGSCTPFLVWFKNTMVPSTQTTWDFGDGSAATGDNVSHTYMLPGSYTVVMISKGTAGCIFKSVKMVKVTAPAGMLLYNGGYVCSGNGVRLEVKATDAAQYTFVFGDGDSLTTTTAVISHSYTQPGNYIPYVYMIAGNCRIKAFTGDTLKADVVKAGFSSSSRMTCGNTVIQFLDTSYAYFGVISRHWNFGDGTASSLPNPSKIYTQDVTNFVELAISSASGCTDTLTLPVDVHVRNFPQSTIGSDSVGCAGQILPMAALLVSQDSIAGVSWNFGNGTTGSGMNVKPVYNTPGLYTVTLVTSTTFGCADTAYKTIRINASPIVNAGADARICLGQSVQLQAFGAATWQWTPVNNLSCTNCSDPLANPVLTTTYVAVGTNLLGCSVADTVLVEVVQPFTITVSPGDTLCIGSQTQLFATGATNYLWNPATGLSSATAPNPIAKPLVTTPYRVIAGDAFGCFADTGYVVVVVGPYPAVELGSGSLVVAGTTVPFNPTLTNGPFKNYVWTPDNNLSCTDCPRPVATINTNVTYRLEAENIYGCKASDTISFRVECEDALQVFIPNSFSPDGDHVNDVFMVRGRGLAMVKYLRVFNRWGELVFERNNFSANDPAQGWDGKVRGVPANPDVYVYTAEIICTAGGEFVRKGNVTLFR